MYLITSTQVARAQELIYVSKLSITQETGMYLKFSHFNLKSQNYFFNSKVIKNTPFGCFV